MKRSFLMISLLLTAIAVQTPSAAGFALTPDASVASPEATRGAVFDGLIGEGLMARPTAIALGPEGTIWIADQDTDQIFILDSTGNVLDTFGSTGTGPGQFDFANFGSLDVMSDGTVFVLDTGNERVQKFNADLEFQLEWGKFGSAPGEFNAASDIVVSDDGQVYVVDDLRRDVQQFDANGKYIRSIAPTGDTTRFFEPARLGIDSVGNVYVPDITRIYVFNPAGELIRTIMTTETGNGDAGAFNGIAVTEDGDLYATDAVLNRISIFDPDGVQIGSFGSSGSGEGEFQEPDKMFFLPDGRLIVLDYANNRVQSFRLIGVDH